MEIEKIKRDFIMNKQTKALLYNKDFIGDIELTCCKACGDEFTSIRAFFIHMNRPSVNISFKCPICDKLIYFSNRCQTVTHFTSHKNFVVNFKDLTIRPLSVNSMKKHMIHLKTLFSDLKDMNRSEAMATVNMINNFEYRDKCIVCKEIFQSTHVSEEFEVKKQHYQKLDLQSPMEALMCSCGCLLPNMCALTLHKKLHGNRDKSNICPECGTEILDIETFENHINDVCKHYSRAMIIRCPLNVCSKLIPDKDLFAHYEKEHIIDEFFICSICRNSFTNKEHFKAHNSSLHQHTAGLLESFSCNMCPKDAVFSGKLRSRHMWKHYKTAERIAYKYFCKQCNVTLNDFKNHICVLGAISNLNLSSAVQITEDQAVGPNKSLGNAAAVVENPFSNVVIHQIVDKHAENAQKFQKIFKYEKVLKTIPPTDSVKLAKRMRVEPPVAKKKQPMTEGIVADNNEPIVKASQNVEGKKMATQDPESLENNDMYITKGGILKSYYKCGYCNKKYKEEKLFEMHAKSHGMEFLFMLTNKKTI